MFIFVHAEYVKRKDFMMGLSCKHGRSHLIRRDHIYSDVLELYEDFSKVLNEFPFRISFKDEHAVDSGGVARDMFSGFWSCAFEKFFDGSGSVVPASHPTVDMSIFPMLGKILSHGYIACGFLPVHISFPVIAAVFLGPDVQISDTILFITYLSYHDACILKSAFGELGSKTFSCNLQSSLMILLGKYGCRQVPSPENIKSLVTKVARHTFVVKPLASLFAMFGGIAAEHKGFWKDVTVDHLMEVYLASNATAYNALKVIKEPLVLDPEPLQETTYGYLLQYVGNMRNAEVRNFLRFVTGSSALVVDEIKITFNGLSGVSRRPIAHTCSCTLELSTSYSTYLEFAQEFDAILTSELSWIMDAL